MLGDETILTWIEKDGKNPQLKRQIREKCKAFTAWLEESDDDSDDESE